MKRTFSCLVALVLVITGMAVHAMAEEQIYIGVSMQGNQSGFIQYISSGIWEYQQTNAPDIRLEVVFADDDAAKQLSQVETFISKGVDAIILNPVDKVQSAAAVDLAFEKGIPVITVNTLSDSKNVAAHVGSDDVESGRLQMQRLLDVCGPNMKVVYVDAVLGHSAQIGRAQGYKEVLDANPTVTLVAHDTGNWSADESMKLVENWIQSGKEFDAVACNADCQLIGVITAIENAGLIGKVKLSGMDCDPMIMDAIKKGIVDSSIWQDGVGQGENALRIAIEAAKGNAVEDFFLPYEVCSGENIDEYMARADARNALAKKYF
jgi:inositol transport system substrate-binding protein